MKIRYLLLAMAVLVCVIYWLNALQSEAYASCVAAGKQSNDTCRYYTL